MYFKAFYTYLPVNVELSVAEFALWQKLTSWMRKKTQPWLTFSVYKKQQQKNQLLTSDLSDTLQGVFERAESAGVALGFALDGQPQLQLLYGLH